MATRPSDMTDRRDTFLRHVLSRRARTPSARLPGRSLRLEVARTGHLLRLTLALVVSRESLRRANERTSGLRDFVGLACLILKGKCTAIFASCQCPISVTGLGSSPRKSTTVHRRRFHTDLEAAAPICMTILSFPRRKPTRTFEKVLHIYYTQLFGRSECSARFVQII